MGILQRSVPVTDFRSSLAEAFLDRAQWWQKFESTDSVDPVLLVLVCNSCSGLLGHTPVFVSREARAGVGYADGTPEWTTSCSLCHEMKSLEAIWKSRDPAGSIECSYFNSHGVEASSPRQLNWKRVYW